MTAPTLSIGSSPHVRSGHSVHVIMRNVVYALLPVCAYAIWLYGLSAALTLLTALLSCVATEHWLSRSARGTSTVGDYSAVITGLLYGLTLPPSLPLWMVALGGFVGIALAKYLFGGLGYNAFNPALVGRAFLQAAFPASMTTWHPPLLPDRFVSLPEALLTFPFARPVYDVLSGATPLTQAKFEQQLEVTPDLLLGLTSGSLGESGALLILAGGAYLAARNMMNWRIPVAVLGTVALASALASWLQPGAYAGPLFMLFSGGLMLGAVFMATDMVASPLSHRGAVAYGILIGLLVVVIRYWGGMPEGVMYAILLANAASPHLDKLFPPRPPAGSLPSKGVPG